MSKFVSTIATESLLFTATGESSSTPTVKDAVADEKLSATLIPTLIDLTSSTLTPLWSIEPSKLNV